MPTYLAKCPKCSKELEYYAKIQDKEKDLPECPDCLIKMITAFLGATGGFILKGQGWFKKGGY